MSGSVGDLGPARARGQGRLGLRPEDIAPYGGDLPGRIRLRLRSFGADGEMLEEIEESLELTP